jgi:hypothetical protein
MMAGVSACRRSVMRLTWSSVMTAVTFSCTPCFGEPLDQGDR